MADTHSRAISSWAQLDPRDIPAALLPLAPALAGARPESENEGDVWPTVEGRRIGALIVLATASTTITGLILLMRSLLATLG